MDKLIETIVSAIEDKKGKNIASYAGPLPGFDRAICSHFVVCNADSTTQVAAIAGGIEEKVLETLGEKVWRVEGQQNALWIAMDYVDVVVHISDRSARFLQARGAVGRCADGEVRIRSVNLIYGTTTEEQQ